MIMVFFEDRKFEKNYYNIKKQIYFNATLTKSEYTATIRMVSAETSGLLRTSRLLYGSNLTSRIDPRIKTSIFITMNLN